MPLKRVFFLFLMVAFAAGSVAAQVSETDSQREEREKRDAEMLRQYLMRSLPAPDLSALLSAERAVENRDL